MHKNYLFYAEVNLDFIPIQAKHLSYFHAKDHTILRSTATILAVTFDSTKTQ
jgi:hypothetical protein